MSIKDHKKEVIRWLNSPEGTGVWCKHKSDKSDAWAFTQHPVWDEDTIYVVDSKYAELRKEWIDKGKPQLQKRISINGKWQEWKDVEGEAAFNPEYHFEYRIKPSEWETPQSFVDLVEKKKNIKFTLDACACDHTAKAPKWFTEEDDALTKEWKGTVWVNPPYGGELPKWLKYAYDQAKKNDSLVVCLIPARTDTAWFHDIAIKGEIIFLRGRIKFEQQGEKTGSPAFPPMLVIFNGKKTRREFHTWEWENEKQ